MSGKSIKKILKDFGLADNQAKIYIFLAKHGVLKGGEIAKQAKMPKAVVYRTLKILQSKGFVESTLESPARFTAVPFEVIIDYNIKTKKEEALQIENSKKDLLNDWQTMNKQKSAPSMPKFTVIEGNKKIYGKISEMIKNTKQKISIISSSQGLLRAERLGILDEIINHPLKNKIKIRFITEVVKQNLKVIKPLYRNLKGELNLKARTPEIGSPLSPRMVLRDNKEIMFFITAEPTLNDEACFCTNCKSIIQAYSRVFEELWNNSLSIEKKIDELETGKPALQMKLIKDKKTAEKLYFDSLDAAKKEILIVTSSKRLKGLSNNITSLNKWCRTGVSIKIMAPITGENVEVAANLLECCEIRHIPFGYSEMTIIDDQNLFQFNNPTSENNDEVLNLENVFFTNDIIYVGQAKRIINNVWKNIHALSVAKAKTVVDPQINNNFLQEPTRYSVSKLKGIIHLEDETPFDKLTEKDLLNMIKKTKKNKLEKSFRKAVRLYGTYGQAKIHPPKHLGLPEMEFNIYHFDKHSKFGEENSLLLGVLRDTPNGPAYIPSAFIGDNPQALDFVKILFKDLIPDDNFQLVDKEKLQVRTQGNNLFCGWVIPIPLLENFVLPPASILLEGYGTIRTKSFSNCFTSGYRMDQARNYLESFVTFFHPASKYSGPGTDGFFARDFIMEIYRQ